MQMIIYIYPLASSLQGFLFNKRYFVIRKLWHFAALRGQDGCIGSTILSPGEKFQGEKNVRAAVFIVT